MNNNLAFLDVRLVDASQNIDEVKTVLVEDGTIKAIETHVAPSLLEEDYEIIDGTGKTLIPGLVDFQTRTGEPGNEYEETLASAGKAAVAGGVTSMVVQPDTQPVIDDIALVDFISRNASATAPNHVYVMGALTKDLKGIEMSELRLMNETGAVAFTNGKNPIANSQVMRRALSYASDFDGLIVHHVEDKSLTVGGVMNEGEMATRLGLPGIPKMAEIIMLERDIRLAELTGGNYHAASISCAESVEIIKNAKARGLNVSCGASINNLTLNENDIGAYRTFFKLSPPLRLEEDRLAILEGVRDGTIDVIHSDHCPRDVDLKRHPFADASDGAIGLETLLPAILRLYHDNQLNLTEIIKVLSHNPSKLLKLNAGSLKKGMPADIVLLDLDAPWVLDEKDLVSLSKNTAFEGARFTGRVLKSYVRGKEVFSH